MSGPGRPVWDDLASPEDLAALDPPPPEDWDKSPDVLVIGGGVIGLSVATFCRREGLRVVLVERDRLADHASGRAAGGLSPDGHPECGDAWHELARASLALHRELDAEWDYGLRTLDVLVPPDLRIPEQAHVDPLRLAATLARHAGTILTRTESTFTLTSGGRIVGVRTSRGTVQPETVVFATGVSPPQAPNVCPDSVKGHLIATEAASFVLPELMTDGEILVVQVPATPERSGGANGRLVAGGTKDRDDTTDDVDDAVVARIQRRMCELVPQADGLSRTHAWCCFRPCASDELPVIDRVPGLSNAWMVAGLFSTGILMAPIIGLSVARWIGGGPPVAGFGLDRLRL